MELIKELTRNEMRNIMAGGDPMVCPDDWTSCDCFVEEGGEKLGSACCTGLTGIQCCQVSFKNSNYMECELPPA